MHTIRRIVVKYPTRRWMFIVEFKSPINNELDREIERFENAREAYSFCSWLNGGDFASLTPGTWDALDAPLPEEDEEE